MGKTPPIARKWEPYEEGGILEFFRRQQSKAIRISPGEEGNTAGRFSVGLFDGGCPGPYPAGFPTNPDYSEHFVNLGPMGEYTSLWPCT